MVVQRGHHILTRARYKGQGCSTVVKYLHGKHVALSSIPKTKNNLHVIYVYTCVLKTQNKIEKIPISHCHLQPEPSITH